MADPDAKNGFLKYQEKKKLSEDKVLEQIGLKPRSKKQIVLQPQVQQIQRPRPRKREFMDTEFMGEDPFSTESPFFPKKRRI